MFLRATDRHRSVFVFLLCWLLGSIFGMVLSYLADERQLSLMRAVACNRVSIVWLLFWAVFPFMVTALAVHTYRKWVIFPMIFLKGCLYSFLAMIIFGAFGSAGWLIHPLLQFTQVFCFPVYCWFGLRCLVYPGSLRKDLLFCIVFVAIVVIIDWAFVSPFLVSLM